MKRRPLAKPRPFKFRYPRKKRSTRPPDRPHIEVLDKRDKPIAEQSDYWNRAAKAAHPNPPQP